MPISMRSVWTLLLLGTVAVEAAGQALPDLETGPPLPLRPRTQQERNQLEARRLYARGLLQERDSLLLDALQSFEQAAKLDPDAAPPRKALIPLYLALDRGEDALGACRKALDLDPDDYETWYLYARQLRARAKNGEALTALARAAACPALKEVPEQFAQISFDLAQLYEESKDHGRALAALEEILKLVGDDDTEIKLTEIHETIAKVCTAAGRYDRAIQALRKSQELLGRQDPFGSRRLDYALAKIYWDQGKAAEALRSLDQYLTMQPAGTEPYELQIRILRKLERGGEVVKSLEAASSRDGHNVALKLLLAHQYVEERQFRQADALLRALVKEAPTPEVYRGLFALFRREGRMVDALNMLDQTIKTGAGDGAQPADAAALARARAMIAALRNDPESARELIPAARLKLRNRDKLEPRTQQFLAVVAARSRQLDVAEQLYRSFLDAAPNSQNEPVVYGGLLQVLWEADKFEGVVEVCRRGLRDAHFTNRLLFHANLSRALVLLGKADEALAEADRAVRLSDDDGRLHFRLARVRVLTLMDRFDQAEAECLELLKESKKTEEIHEIRYTLSNVYSAAHAPEKSEVQLRLVLELDPADATANNDLGYIMADQGKNLDEAEKLVRKAIELDQRPTRGAKNILGEENQPNAAYIDSLGWVLFRRGRFADARHELEKAVALPEGAADPVVWDHLGDVYFRLDALEQARTAWRKAVSLYETRKRRKLDEPYKELKHKLQLLEAEAHHP